MALSVWKWLVLAATACAMIWFGLLYRPSTGAHAVGEQRRSNAVDPSPAQQVMGGLSQANNRLRLLQLRDSILASPVQAGDDGLRVTFDGSLSPETRVRIQSGLHARWKSLHAGSKVPVTIAFVVDSVTTPNGLPRSRSFTTIPVEVFLPSAETHGGCFSLVHLSFSVDGQVGEFARQVRAALLSRETIESELSPCVFYATFGAPGENVAHWLFANRWREARLVAWDSTPAAWRATVNANRYAFGGADALMIQADPAWEIRRYVAPDGIACLAGDESACRRIVVGTVASAADSAWRWSVVSTAGTNRFAFYLPQDVPPLGPSVGLVVSDMVRTLGVDRFTKFWQSNAPVEKAFQQATGVGIGRWTHDWATSMYGKTTVGPSLATPGLVAGIVVVLLGVVLACVLAERRTVM